MNILTEEGARPVIGHRGNRAHAPENTIESFAQAVALGVDAIEFDVHLSADGIPVVHHDPVLGRTSDGTGEIARMTFADLRRADAGARFTKDGGRTYPYRGMGHRIPTLEEVVEAFPSTTLLVEIKAPLASVQVRKILEQRGAVERTLIDSFRPEALDVFEGSGIARGGSRDNATRAVLEAIGGPSMGPVDFQAFCLPLEYYGFPLPHRRLAKVAARHGARLHIWTVNDVAVAGRLWSYGVNGIISDDPAVMLKLRESLPGGTA